MRNTFEYVKAPYKNVFKDVLTSEEQGRTSFNQVIDDHIAQMFKLEQQYEDMRLLLIAILVEHGPIKFTPRQLRALDTGRKVHTLYDARDQSITVSLDGKPSQE